MPSNGRIDGCRFGPESWPVSFGSGRPRTNGSQPTRRIRSLCCARAANG